MSLNPYQSPQELPESPELPADDQPLTSGLIYWPLMSMLALVFSLIPTMIVGLLLMASLYGVYGDFIPDEVQRKILATCASLSLLFVLLFLRLVTAKPFSIWWCFLPALLLVHSVATLIHLVMLDVWR